jgi:HTH-type transcriptional repressor of NAD biosynthesis genes
MKRFRHGLVLGKFLPLHAGHVQLIKRALESCESVTVQLLGSIREEIPLSLRREWLVEEFPTANVVAAYDEVPVDFERADIWDAHMLIIEGLLTSPVDAVFTSDDYGAELARRLDADWIQVDPGRRNVAVSGTGIRENPFENWKFLPPAVRSFYTRRVVVLGAESTGTTTLAQALAQQLDCEVVAEYGRQWTEIRPGGLAALWRSEEFEMIARTQLEMEEAAARRTQNGWLVCDTDAFATILWHERYTGLDSRALRKLADAMPGRRIYILTSDDIPWVDDGLRDGREIRSAMQSRFRSELSRQKLPWCEVRGDRGTRLECAIHFIKSKFTEDGRLNLE